ncbi:hypothetical protein GPA10_04990 [Streptomyces sp. p1417]|uniref:Uncharacterized protein n=1 Tax=Streptomyces typhae TaxID=2681492 RepID=A0A6L6WVX6_9ACTN|nr:hypothetical protein [Streptomyces typhae]MVO84141.1 hypothetical protein [Streptomyces typhae]
MSGSRRRRAPPEREYVPGALLDWNDSGHWDYERAEPCRYCKVPTQLRDSKGSHAHKTCAEEALAQQAAEAADAYQNGQP